MIKAALRALLRRKYNNYVVYVHNLSNFDANFFLKYLVELTHVKLVYKEGRIISIRAYYGEKDKKGKYPYSLTFQDSYQKLPASLKQLAINFGLETRKTIFPYEFINDANLSYYGPVPDKKYYPKDAFASEQDYNNYVNIAAYADYKKKWDLREEAIKYCMNDCNLLLQVIVEFNLFIFEKFGVDANKSPTLSSLSFKIFRKNYFDQAIDKIPVYRFKDEAKIRNSFTGGSVDLFKPTNLELSSNDLKAKEKLWYYDFNSLFPSVLRNFDFPCGNVRHFVGNILELEKNPIGFFKVNVTAPLNLKMPVLQTRIVRNESMSTVSPVGTFTGWYFSEELFNARDKFGYEFEILEGYVYSKREKLFSGYINALYEMRVLFDKSDIRNYISKILLNSFYGRWAMSPYFSETKLLAEKEYLKLMEKGDITNLDEVVNFNNGHYLVIFSPDMENIDRFNSLNSANVSIGIAAATTAYSRIVMSQFKNRPEFELYYSDTDSLILNVAPDKLEQLYPGIIGKNLGQLKLEYEVDKAVFLSPKCYILITAEGEKVLRIKGFNLNSNTLTPSDKDLNLKDFVSLLQKDANIKLTQDIWVKDKSQALIATMEQAYSLAHNNNKREIIYDINNFFSGTQPIKLDEVHQKIENSE